MGGVTLIGTLALALIPHVPAPTSSAGLPAFAPPQLTALGEAVGSVSRGLSAGDIAALPRRQYFEVAGTTAGGEEQCPICRRASTPSWSCPWNRTEGLHVVHVAARAAHLPTFPLLLLPAAPPTAPADAALPPSCRVEFEAEDWVRVLPLCAHYYHPPCIEEWLRRNKACCICAREVKPEGQQGEGGGGGGGREQLLPETALAPAAVGAGRGSGSGSVLGERQV